MKICYFGDATSIHVMRWCRHFKELGHEIVLISFAKSCDIEGVEFYSLSAGDIDVRGGNWRTLLSGPKLRRILLSVRPDILHSMYATSYGITGALAFYKPYVMTPFGSDILVSCRSSRLIRTLVRWALGRADWITVSSVQMKEEIVRMGLPADEVAMIPFGIDPSVFYRDEKIAKSSVFQFLSTRNFEPIYNHALFIQALALLKQENPSFRVRMLGKGSQEQEIRQLVHDQGLVSQVDFLGHVPQADIATLLNESHVYVSFSLSDANHVSLNEAQACGVIPVVTDIPANQQWITHGYNGFLTSLTDPVDVKDKLLKVMSEYDVLKKEMIPINEAIVAEKAIWNHNMAQVEQKYQEILNSRK